MKCTFCDTEAGSSGYTTMLDRGPNSNVKRTVHIACLVEAYEALENEIAAKAPKAHVQLLERRNAILSVLRGFLDEPDASERANNIASALQDGFTSPFVASMRMLERKIPNMARRTRCAELIRDAWDAGART